MKNCLSFLIIVFCNFLPVVTYANEEDNQEEFTWDYYLPSYEEILRVGKKVEKYKYISIPVYWPNQAEKIEKAEKAVLFHFGIDVEESFKRQGPCLGISATIGQAEVFLTNDISNNLDVRDDFIENENPLREVGIGMKFKF